MNILCAFQQYLQQGAVWSHLFHFGQVLRFRTIQGKSQEPAVSQEPYANLLLICFLVLTVKQSTGKSDTLKVLVHPRCVLHHPSCFTLGTWIFFFFLLGCWAGADSSATAQSFPSVPVLAAACHEDDTVGVCSEEPRKMMWKWSRD